MQTVMLSGDVDVATRFYTWIRRARPTGVRTLLSDCDIVLKRLCVRVNA